VTAHNRPLAASKGKTPAFSGNLNLNLNQISQSQSHPKPLHKAFKKEKKKEEKKK